jgi:hypothetical protein
LGEYEALITADPNNKVLGESADYYTLYEREQIELLKQQPVVSKPQTCDEWMIPVAKNIDLDKVQFPLIMVQEYGLNLFRLAAGASLALEQIENVTLRTKTIVSNIQEECNADGWRVTYIKDDKTDQESFDYLINAAGFRSGKIDDLLGVPCKRMVEFKAAYVSKWNKGSDTLWPEIIFHGERGTPRGMGQFTPYPGGYFQLHGMTKEITLYEDGLVSNTALSCQPQLGQNFIKKIEFPTKRYARCEIVKVSSVIDMIDTIIEQFIELGFLDKSVQGKRDFTYLANLTEADITHHAEALCKERSYPISLGNRNVSEPIHKKSLNNY